MKTVKIAEVSGLIANQ